MMAQLLSAFVAVTLIAGPRAFTSVFSPEDRAAFQESLRRLKADKRRYRIRYALGMMLMALSIAIGVTFILRVRDLLGHVA
jgi:hypothetical protein